MALLFTLDGVQYPLEEKDGWTTLQQGKLLTEYFNAFHEGMGFFRPGKPGQYWFTEGMETSNGIALRPFIAPTSITGITVTGAGDTYPSYAIRARSANATDYTYILDHRYALKVKLSTNAVIEEKDQGATAVHGRPALFKSQWYFPLGASVDAVKITTVANDPTADTYGTITGIKAEHFAVLQDLGTSKLARALANQISLSSDGTSFGSAFDVGDSSTDITDLAAEAGELIVFKPEGVFKFDTLGNSIKIFEYAGRNPTALSYSDGSDSYRHGALIYYPHSSGLWRIVGNQSTNVGPEANPKWLAPFSDSYSGGEVWAQSFTDGMGNARWLSAAAWGRWFYGTSRQALLVGYIKEDGTILWHGEMYSMAAPGVIRCAITEGPILWVIQGSGIPAVRRFDLMTDGSPSTALLQGSRGAVSTTIRFWAGDTDFGLPDRQKRVRRAWVDARGFGTTSPITLLVLRDWSTTEEAVGAAITSNGVIERAWTVGTNDAANRVIVGLEIAFSASYAPSTDSPMIMGVGIQALTATVYRIVIPLTPDSLKGTGLSWEDALKKLRDLKSGQSITVFEPNSNLSFTGYVVGKEERITELPNNQVGYQIALQVEVWDR